jgi:hypothetical protein
LTKVNRCLTEGRRAFLQRVGGIESGAECERLAPLLSALADGEADAGDLAALRSHLRSCLACRATLREFRSTPARVAALAPPIALVPEGRGSLTDAFESAWAWVHERAMTLAVKLNGAVEVASAHKVAAVAASTAVLAGGGAATIGSLEQAPAAPAAPTVAEAPSAPTPPVRRPAEPARSGAQQSPKAGAPRRTVSVEPAKQQDTSSEPARSRATTETPSQEFGPGEATSNETDFSDPGDSESSGGSGESSGDGSGEFGP